jgi:hypothetical protein
MRHLIFCALLTLSYCSAIYAIDGEVVKMKGSPKYKRQNKTDILTKTTKLTEGDTIITGKSEFVKVIYDKHKFYIFGNSEITITLDKKKNILLDQKKGTSWFKINPLRSEKSFKVKTPSAVAGVRGTAFSIQIDSDSVTAVCVCEGSVEVEAGGVKKLLKQSFGSKLMKGLPPFKAHSNTSLLRQKRKLGRRPLCMNCHDENSEYKD